MQCNYCGRPAQWEENKIIYGKNFGRSYMVWICLRCKAYVGCHNNTKRPLGTLANSEDRTARTEAHRAIDKYWKNTGKTRRSVYEALKKHFGYEVHIGESDKNTCEKIIKASKILFKKTNLKYMWIIESSLKGIVGYYTGDAEGLLRKIYRISHGIEGAIIEFGGVYEVICETETFIATRVS